MTDYGLASERVTTQESPSRHTRDRYLASDHWLVGTLLVLLAMAWAWPASVGVLFAVAIGLVLAIFGYRYLHQHRGSAAETGSLQATQDGAIALDISQDEPVSGGAGGQLARQHNQLLASMREALANLRRHSVKVAVESTRLRKLTGEAQESAHQQKAVSEQIAQSSGESATALDDITQRTSAVSRLNSDNLEAVRESNQALNDVAQRIESASQHIQSFQQTVRGLSESADKIGHILELVQGFSSQTNLLALNAAIEAARAGEQGRGFAVVADEVRQLAEKIAAATGDVSGIIQDMEDRVRQTETDTGELIDQTEATRERIGTTASQFNQMLKHIEEAHDDLIAISASVEQVSLTNRQVHEHSGDIQRLGQTLAEEIGQSDDYSAQLREATEASISLLASYRIGQGAFERILEERQALRARFEQALETLLAEGVDIFDRHYEPVPDTQPKKHRTGYVDAFKAHLQDLIDQSKETFAGTTYSLIVDVNGYLAVHHSPTSKPLTGDPDHDLLYSRDQRLYNNSETEKRRAINTQPFLLQTYVRDTGEILNDLALPLYVNGKHWGALCMGFRPELLLEDDDNVTRQETERTSI